MDTLEPAATESDSLESLEERIHQIVQVVTRLRKENQAALEERDEARAAKAALEAQMEKAAGEKQTAVERAARALAALERTSAELESLKAERNKVRSRIERLLGQIDQLSGAQT